MGKSRKLGEAPRKRRDLNFVAAVIVMAPLLSFATVSRGAVHAAAALRTTSAARTAPASLTGDFNGDGYGDFAIGDAYGTVTVFYGSSSGPRTSAYQVFTPTTAGMPSQLATVCQAAPQCNFGYSLVTGDFNGDGYSDLAIGVPCYGYTVDGYVPGDDGAVVILFGGSTGLTTAGSEFIAAPSSIGAAAGSGWGWSLATGNFNGDAYSDLAIGAPFDVVGSVARAGALTIMYGSASGITPSQTVYTENTVGIPDRPASDDDGFGWTVVSGDFTGDGYGDVAVSGPGSNTVDVLYGSASGITTARSQYLLSVGPYAAYSMAAGDFTGNGVADLAIGDACANMVEIHYGSARGLGSAAFKTAQEITPTSKGIPSSAKSDMWFGMSLAAGDVKGTGRAALVVGSGWLAVALFGGSTRLTPSGSELLSNRGARFGLADLNGDGHADLVAADPTPQSPTVPYLPAKVYKGSSTGVSQTAFLTFDGSVTGWPWAYSIPGSYKDNQVCQGP